MITPSVDYLACAILTIMEAVGECNLIHLECPECGLHFDADSLQSICLSCNSPLVAIYDLEKTGQVITRDKIKNRERGIWRWAELLPVRNPENRLSLGEGDTPLLRLKKIAKEHNLRNLWIKEEAVNPTGSFKARGLAVAVSRAMELGVKECFIPTAGNAGGALAAYAARAGIRAHVFMPADAPRANQEEVRRLGADLHLIDGLIHDAARLAREDSSGRDWLDFSTFHEPYRLEGKKTLGFELAEIFAWNLPDIIIYPTGGGTGLVGMWKAFDELEALGWISSFRPRMISIQAEGCAPLVRAFEAGASRSEFWDGAETSASGLRVPALFADRLALRVLKESNGLALSVSESEIKLAQDELALNEGILACPEGAASLAGLLKLHRSDNVNKDEKIVIFNTGSGLKYI